MQQKVNAFITLVKENMPKETHAALDEYYLAQVAYIRANADIVEANEKMMARLKDFETIISSLKDVISNTHIIFSQHYDKIKHLKDIEATMGALQKIRISKG